MWTPPLVELTPETSYGFEVIDFARDVLGTPLDPWEEWAVIHAGELLPDGRPRFRTVLIIVARQNGKTFLTDVLIQYWLFVDVVPLVMGTSTDRSYAKRQWNRICQQVRKHPELSGYLGADAIRRTIGEEALRTSDGAEYIFAANNGRAGRSTTLHRWVCDELREHASRDCWNSATNAMNAVPDAQTVCITNMGDDRSVVLNPLRESAITYLETGQGDPRVGLLEWSCPPGSDPCDPAALAQANPNFGRRVDRDALLGAGRRAVIAGGQELADFRTEVMCMRVPLLDPAVDPDLWAAAKAAVPLDLAPHRRNVACCLDISLDGSHATLTAAVLHDGRVHLDVVKAWSGYGCTREVRRDLPDLIAKVKPRVLGWFPTGPAAALAADMKPRAQRGETKRWPPRGVKLQPLTADVAGVCMGLADLVKADMVRHAGDPMQDAHIESAQRLNRGDATWVFQRRGAGPIDGAYSAAGSAHLARSIRLRAVDDQTGQVDAE